MKRTFLDRVRIERQVLNLVNVRFPSQKLNGLTAPAIKSWIRENEEVTSKVSDLVLVISKRARLDVDSSRDVFVDGELELNHSTQYYIAELSKLVTYSD